MRATATFSPKKWDEKTYDQVSPRTKITRASVEFQYTGQVQGEGSVESLMFYSSYDEHDPHKATAEYTGLIRFKGTVNGRTGSFVLEDKGAFEAVTAKSSLRILPGSGMDQLAGITGSGTSVATPKSCHLELEYQFP
jgi:hypothetical protein